MTLTFILIAALAALPFMRLVPARGRPWGLLAGSLLAAGWLQSRAETFASNFTLTAAAVVLTIAVWWIVQPGETENDSRRRETWLALGVMAVLLGLIWLAQPDGRPALAALLPGAGLAGVIALGAAQLFPVQTAARPVGVFRRLALIAVAGIVLLLIGLKWGDAQRVGGLWLALRTPNDLVTPLAWIGFSYVAFRLLALLLDFRAGMLPPDGLALRDVAVYVLFFPAFTAGPIDRAQRFIPDLRQAAPLDAARLVEGGGRIVVGIAKKFILADSLALVSLSPALVERVHGAAGLWLVLYLYTFQIYLDFSGYSDIAIGLGRLYGIALPENFDRPYLQPNVQQFWNHWHITLSTWFRLYFFTPLSRALIRRRWLPTLIIFLAQISTMFLIGMWHGITPNFALWGLWHGVGLFAYRMLADHTRGWYAWAGARPWLRRAITVGSVLVTFHYVALGWVFFALPTPHDSLNMLARLVGLGG